MIKVALTTVFSIIALVVLSFAADITGHWMEKIMEQYDVAYYFKVEGEKLTGKTVSPDGNPIEIKNGVIKGDDLSFLIEIMGKETKVAGKVKGDIITLSMPGMNGEVLTFDLKKEK